ncbi:hypothetical protein C923_05839 [Plasmodium falciparum UGT5.1]|uniref:Uncharacterized protein n=12 Tax=Plasmodium falciparum TaxID=5833 RepID=Q8IKC1_PLAF7|nr:conserved Plasmodium protein, unknown function [Plasmodium falciparum 3D7]ETW15757.1 hypothetical protein PFFVO_05370 [Plasmodium falciparum Vietnam Oak-Knoll (FVO)]ETW33577.1 hypothetical protein PFTANZ_05703 [Plasmodium falciparum Tanzania (2000708)]ETW39511.1 hypothetical protein PFNF135_05542 [Plasmodium falciparum NF135/5.C10]ETW46319.1 hypothetical protein PFMALIP_05562 [Plasmodium falciparum MaliPS096_E11]ETW54388.1 hypothetical protein PFUGPA_04256 [Plasmodium falciparum Palo Alto/U|eukprot:XP_001348859.1 conserved Plasmodium protein, unknown function [Plasmodium falciparum 3D7]
MNKFENFYKVPISYKNRKNEIYKYDNLEYNKMKYGMPEYYRCPYYMHENRNLYNTESCYTPNINVGRNSFYGKTLDPNDKICEENDSVYNILEEDHKEESFKKIECMNKEDDRKKIYNKVEKNDDENIDNKKHNYCEKYEEVYPKDRSSIKIIYNDVDQQIDHNLYDDENEIVCDNEIKKRKKRDRKVFMGKYFFSDIINTIIYPCTNKSLQKYQYGSVENMDYSLYNDIQKGQKIQKVDKIKNKKAPQIIVKF